MTEVEQPDTTQDDDDYAVEGERARALGALRTAHEALLNLSLLLEAGEKSDAAFNIAAVVDQAIDDLEEMDG
jgi:hypothetical protein